VLDCARTLEPGPALAVADSALRRGLVGPAELLCAANGLRGAGRRRVLWVAEHADPRAESGLESVLRAIVLLAGVLGFEPQVLISDDGFRARVDLGHRGLRVVLEADSFEHHGSRAALVRDCRRYDELTIRGWRVLRFAWEQVMFEPEWVAATVGALVRPARCA
jgi:very-short-patch-repair endonuclease